MDFLDAGLGLHPPWKFLQVLGWWFNWLFFLGHPKSSSQPELQLAPGLPHTILFLWGKKNLCDGDAQVRM